MKEDQVWDVRACPEFSSRHFKLKSPKWRYKVGSLIQESGTPKRDLPFSLYLGLSLDCLHSWFLFPGKVGEESKPFLQLHSLVDVEMFLLSSHETQNPVQRLLIHS